MTLFRKILTGAIEKQYFLDVYREYLRYDIPFSARPIQISSELLVLEMYDREMRFDGFSIIRLEDITQIHSKDRKLRMLEEKTKSTTHRIFPELECTNLFNLLKELRLRKQFIAIYRENYSEGCATGIIKDFDEFHLLFDWYGTISTLDRLEGLILQEDLTKIELDSPFVRRIFELHQKNT